MSILKGENTMAFVGGKSIGFATSHSLEINMTPVECSHKDVNGGSWYEAESGIIQWSMSSENFIGNPVSGLGYTDIVNMMIKREPVDLVMALKSTISSNGEAFEVPTGGWTAKANDGFKGKALITSVSANYPNAENSTMSISFQGVGALTPLSSASTASVQTLKANTAKA